MSWTALAARERPPPPSRSPTPTPGCWPRRRLFEVVAGWASGARNDAARQRLAKPAPSLPHDPRRGCRRRRWRALLWWPMSCAPGIRVETAGREPDRLMNTTETSCTAPVRRGTSLPVMGAPRRTRSVRRSSPSRPRAPASEGRGHPRWPSERFRGPHSTPVVGRRTVLGSLPPYRQLAWVRGKRMNRPGVSGDLGESGRTPASGSAPEAKQDLKVPECRLRAGVAVSAPALGWSTLLVGVETLATPAFDNRGPRSAGWDGERRHPPIRPPSLDH